MIFDLKNPLGKTLTISKSAQRHLYDFFCPWLFTTTFVIQPHSTSWSLIVCLLLTVALGCAERWEHHWDRAEPLRFQFKFSFMLALTTNNIISWRKPTIFSRIFPSIRFFYNSMRRNQWRNARMLNCRSKKHGWIEEKIISHRQKKKIQKKTIIRRSFKDSSIKQKWRQMRKISIQD